MTKYRITAPDGKKYDVSGEGTKEEALAHFQSSYSDMKEARNENYSNEGRNYTQTPYQKMSTGEQVGEAIQGSLRRLALPMVPDVKPRELGNTGILLGGVDKAPLQAKADYYAQNKDQMGTAAKVADVATEVAATAMPVAKAGTLLAGTASRVAPKVLPQAAAKVATRVAPAVGDVAANALYSGAKSTGEGNDLGQVLEDTAWGAGGAAVPHALVGGAKAAVKGVRNKVASNVQSKITGEAKALFDKGIDLTPGQASPESWLGRAENIARDKVPFLGGQIEKARGRAGEQFVTKAINEALAPLEKGLDDVVAPSGKVLKTAATGRKGIDEAHDIVSKSYDDHLDDVSIHADDLMGITKMEKNFTKGWKKEPLVGTSYSTRPGLAGGDLVGTPPPLSSGAMALNKGDYSLVKEAINDHIKPIMLNAKQSGEAVTGRQFKNADTAIGELARKAMKTNPKLGEAYYEVQRQLRGSLSATKLGAIEEVKKSNQAFRNLLAIKKAGDREGGMFTPEQLRKAMIKNQQEPSDLVRNAGEVLTKDKGKSQRTLAGAVMTATLPFHPAGYFGLAGGAALAPAYSQRGVRAMRDMMVPSQKAAVSLGKPATRGAKLRKALGKPEYTKGAAQASRMAADRRNKEN